MDDNSAIRLLDLSKTFGRRKRRVKAVRGIDLYGQPLKNNHAILQRRVGGMVEGAAFYPFLTGRRNLEVIAHTGGFYDKERTGMLLEQVKKDLDLTDVEVERLGRVGDGRQRAPPLRHFRRSA